jgi:hypothetical protein
LTKKLNADMLLFVETLLYIETQTGIQE